MTKPQALSQRVGVTPKKRGMLFVFAECTYLANSVSPPKSLT